MNDTEHVINGWQALVMMGPGILSLLTLLITNYFQLKKIDNNTKLTAETKDKVDSVTANQKVTHTLIDTHQMELIDTVKKSAYAEGVLEGLRKEHEFITTAILDGLKTKEIIKQEQEVEALKIIQTAIETKEKLIKDAVIIKEKTDHDIIIVSDKVIRGLNEKLINEK